ncbi:dromaiocalcin-1-like [Ischnura elegans]|uniref:dromaiocalcin-1-like n=1 Tax=Ischnura elegans TaxID=197161 RepID=UPI001ED86D67|nr:dromaiocalcin-1-like [Ischnura elegans]
MVRWQRLVFLIFILTLCYGRSAAHDIMSDNVEGCFVNDLINEANDESIDTLMPSAWFELGGFEYTVYEDDKMNWCSARSHCMALGDGSQLAAVIDRTIVSKLMEEGITNDIWTGGRARGSQWVWENSTDGQLEDDDDCDFVALCLYLDLRNNTGINRLHLEDCGRDLGFICQKDSSSSYETEEVLAEYEEDP